MTMQVGVPMWMGRGESLKVPPLDEAINGYWNMENQFYLGMCPQTGYLIPHGYLKHVYIQATLNGHKRIQTYPHRYKNIYVTIIKKCHEFKTEWKGGIGGDDVNRVLIYEILKKKKD